MPGNQPIKHTCRTHTPFSHCTARTSWEEDRIRNIPCLLLLCTACCHLSLLLGKNPSTWPFCEEGDRGGRQGGRGFPRAFPATSPSLHAYSFRWNGQTQLLPSSLCFHPSMNLSMPFGDENSEEGRQWEASDRRHLLRQGRGISTPILRPDCLNMTWIWRHARAGLLHAFHYIAWVRLQWGSQKHFNPQHMPAHLSAAFSPSRTFPCSSFVLEGDTCAAHFARRHRRGRRLRAWHCLQTGSTTHPAEKRRPILMASCLCLACSYHLPLPPLPSY